MLQDILQPGRAYSFEYPRHNYRQLPTVTETRRCVIKSVRDTHVDLLDDATESLNPLLKRGRWLITAVDLDKDLERSFYLESMSNIVILSDDDLHPLKGIEYIVVAQHHVACKTQQLEQALDFQARRKSGTVCAVLCHGPRSFPVDAEQNQTLRQFRRMSSTASSPSKRTSSEQTTDETTL